MPHRPCLEAGCGSWATYRGRCPAHARSRERVTHRTGRVGHKGRIYGLKRWAMLRRKRLFIEPLCRQCGVVATDADHVVPIEDGGDPWDLENTQSLCTSCHARKTNAELRGRGNTTEVGDRMVSPSGTPLLDKRRS